MKMLEGFNEVEKVWFNGEFAAGRRHFPEKGFNDYYLVGTDITGVEGIKEGSATSYSYSVSDGDEMFYGVVPKDAGESILGTVQYPGAPFDITFLLDTNMENFKQVFGSQAIGICAMSKNGIVQAVLFELGDIVIFPGSSAVSVHGQVFNYGLQEIMAKFRAR